MTEKHHQLSIPTDYGDPEKHPHWGDANDWDFDDLFGCWVYCGEDKQLQKRWDNELTAWENDWKYGPEEPTEDPISRYQNQKRYEKRAKITIGVVVIICICLAIWLLLI